MGSRWRRWRASSSSRLTPATETLDIGSDGCVEATGTDAAGAPVPDVRVDFAVVGPNAASGFASTGANGVARYCWRGATVGEDTVTASIGALSRTAVKRWRVPNRAPAASDDAASTREDQTVELATDSLLADDTDPDGDPLTVTGVSDATTARSPSPAGRSPSSPRATSTGRRSSATRSPTVAAAPPPQPSG